MHGLGEEWILGSNRDAHVDQPDQLFVGICFPLQKDSRMQTRVAPPILQSQETHPSALMLTPQSVDTHSHPHLAQLWGFCHPFILSILVHV